MTNGVVEVSIKGINYRLRFGMQAFLIFQEKSGKSTAKLDSLEGGLKAICDLFFAGMTGNSIRNELPIKSYCDCCDLFDELTMEPNFNDQVAELWRVFNESIKSIGAPSETTKKKAGPKSQKK